MLHQLIASVAYQYRFALILTATAISSTAVAQQPIRVDGDQAADPIAATEQPAGDQFIDPSARDEETESPFYGLLVEEAEDGAVAVTNVKFGSEAWEAGLRKGDRLVSFGDAKDLEYELFLEAIDEVLDRTNESNRIAITVMRDEKPFRTTMRGFGRTPEETKKLRERSEKQQEDTLAQMKEDRRERQDQSPAATTADLGELAELYEKSESKEGLSQADTRRLNRLESTVLSPAAYGTGFGLSAGETAAVGTGNTGQWANGSAAGSSSRQASRFNRLSSELSSLRQQAGSGVLSREQTQRLNSLERLSRSVGSRLQQSATSARFSPQMQAKYQQLQSASQRPGFTSSQRRQLNQYRQRERMIRSSQGSNQNLPFGGRGGVGGGNQNLTGQQRRAAQPSARNPARAGNGGAAQGSNDAGASGARSGAGASGTSQ